MLRVILLFIILIHGLIHLMGFAKEWRLAEVKELTGKTILPLTGNTLKLMGVLWLATCLLFVFSGVVLFLQKDWWLIIAPIAVLLSQVLIIIYWQDAKFGTIANLIILVACFLAYSFMIF